MGAPRETSRGNGAVMGLRSTLKDRVKKVFQRFSGEYSSAAPEELKPYATGLGEDPSRKVVRAKLERPKGKAGASADADEAGE
jgi:hypothetical protein